MNDKEIIRDFIRTAKAIYKPCDGCKDAPAFIDFEDDGEDDE